MKKKVLIMLVLGVLLAFNSGTQAVTDTYGLYRTGMAHLCDIQQSGCGRVKHSSNHTCARGPFELDKKTRLGRAWQDYHYLYRYVHPAFVCSCRLSGVCHQIILPMALDWFGNITHPIRPGRKRGIPYSMPLKCPKFLYCDFA
jgi:hypothetical protein